MVRKLICTSEPLNQNFHQTFFDNSYYNINICIVLNHLQRLFIQDGTDNLCISQPTQDVMGTFPKAFNFSDLQGLFRGPPGDQYRNLRFNDKIIFYKQNYISTSAFYRKNEYSNVLDIL